MAAVEAPSVVPSPAAAPSQAAPSSPQPHAPAPGAQGSSEHAQPAAGATPPVAAQPAAPAAVASASTQAPSAPAGEAALPAAAQQAAHPAVASAEIQAAAAPAVKVEAPAAAQPAAPAAAVSAGTQAASVPAGKAASPAAAQPAAPAAAASVGTRPALAPAAKPVNAADSESDDDLPLAHRRLSGVVAPPKAPPITKPVARQNGSAAPKRKQQSDAARVAHKKQRPAPASDAQQRRKARPDALAEPSSESEESSEEDDDSEEEAVRPKRKREAPARQSAKRKAGATKQRAKAEADSRDIKWTTLEHAGVLFPPEYQPHGVKLLYEGEPVDLTPEQEEVATFFAVMKKTDYMDKPVFINNFWAGFREILGKKHKIQSLEKCDFTPIYDWHMAEREKIKNRSKEEKLAIKAEKEVAEAKFKTAKVDGKIEQVGNFRVEPPGLFRGRGEHPKMGRIKRRIYPKDITINIGKGVPTPEHPYSGQHWKEVRHDNTVTWLAFWKDPISTNSFKYVWLAANSGFKSESDQAKYEKARKLKKYIGPIRKRYEADWKSSDVRVRQIATALYFIDVLALRAGHEKDEDEADTVGCCNLKAENVRVLEDELKPNTIEFDFLGKDSIQYQKEVEVRPTVYNNVKRFVTQTCHGKKKKPGEQLFDAFDATDLNRTLKEAMEGLSAKVFRTYNASVTLDRLLWEQEESPTVEARKADYDRANKEVAILCNHQRAVGKAHDSQMEKMEAKLGTHRAELALLQDNLRRARAGKPSEDKDGNVGKVLDPSTVKARIQKKEEVIHKQELTAKVKEDLKTVALGTSKINYLDPRISVSWCKRHEVPMEKVFNKSLLSKFFWAMDVEPDFRF